MSGKQLSAPTQGLSWLFHRVSHFCFQSADIGCRRARTVPSAFMPRNIPFFRSVYSRTKTWVTRSCGPKTLANIRRKKKKEWGAAHSELRRASFCQRRNMITKVACCRTSSYCKINGLCVLCWENEGVHHRFYAFPEFTRFFNSRKRGKGDCKHSNKRCGRKYMLLYHGSRRCIFGPTPPFQRLLVGLR